MTDDRFWPPTFLTRDPYWPELAQQLSVVRVDATGN